MRAVAAFIIVVLPGRSYQGTAHFVLGIIPGRERGTGFSMGKSHDELRGSGEGVREVAENNEPSILCFIFCLQGARKTLKR